MTVCLSLSDRRLTYPQLRQKVETDLGVTVSAYTNRKRLNSAGLRGCVAVKKPLLCEVNVKAHLNFVLKHRNWTVEQWSDESTFELFCGSSGLTYAGGFVRGTAHSA